MDQLGWVSDSVPSPLISRWRSGGAMNAAPRSSLAPSRASLTINSVLRLRSSAIRLRWRGSRCCTTTIDAGKPLGSPPRTELKACKPPAEAARATISNGVPRCPRLSPMGSGSAAMGPALPPIIGQNQQMRGRAPRGRIRADVPLPGWQSERPSARGSDRAICRSVRRERCR